LESRFLQKGKRFNAINFLKKFLENLGIEKQKSNKEVQVNSLKDRSRNKITMEVL